MCIVKGCLKMTKFRAVVGAYEFVGKEGALGERGLVCGRFCVEME